MKDTNVKAHFETYDGSGFTLVKLDNAVKVVVKTNPDSLKGWCGASRVIGDYFTDLEVDSLRCNFTIRQVRPRRKV